MNPTDPTESADDNPADDLLRRILRDEAATVQPRTDWDDVVRRAHTTDRGVAARRILAIAAAVALIGLVAGAFVLLRDDGDAPVIADEPTPTTPSPTTPGDPDAADGDVADDDPDGDVAEDGPDESPDETAPDVVGGEFVVGRTVEPLDLPAGAPLPDDHLVALRLDDNGGDPAVGTLVVLDADDGSVVRTLVTGLGSAEGGAYHLALTPDRATVLYSYGTSACTTRIEAVAADGSTDAVDVLDGNQATVSRDGTWIALDPRNSCEPLDQIELIPLAGGDTLLFGEGGAPLSGITDPALGSAGGLVDLAFADDQRLVYVVSGGAAPEAMSTHLLDLSDATSRGLAGTPVGTTFSSLEPYGPGGVSAIATCCGAGGDRRNLTVFLPNGDPEDVPLTDAEVGVAYLKPGYGVVAVRNLAPESELRIGGVVVAGITHVAG